MLIRVPPRWRIASRNVTAEQTYIDRRRFLGQSAAGLIGGSIAATLAGPACATRMVPKDAVDHMREYQTRVAERFAGIFPANTNPGYSDAGRPLTREPFATTHVNFYEFTSRKDEVSLLVRDFEPFPWQVEVTGLCHRPRVFDVDDLVRRFDQEERIYRFRCVEAWAMTIPWTGFALHRLLAEVEPTADARFVRFESFDRPAQAPGQRLGTVYRWPYYEGLRLDEAMHPLAFVATGLYGRPLPKQNGAPIRIVVPWKYGYKGPKSVTRIELVAERPHTFWNDLHPGEYSFLSNVDPEVKHPRWSQAKERLLGEARRVPTRKFNGYDEVAALYTGAG